MVELAISFCAAVLLFANYKKSKQALSMGIAFAVLSWFLGELFWFSYESIIGNELPYPSVGDFGFLGVYFFIAGSIGAIKSHRQHALPIWALSLAIMLLPVSFVVSGGHPTGELVYNFIFIFAIAYVINRVLSKYSASYRWFFSGILLFCLTDIVFVIEANTRSFTIFCDMLYPLSLSLLAYGAVKDGDGNR